MGEQGKVRFRQLKAGGQRPGGDGDGARRRRGNGFQIAGGMAFKSSAKAIPARGVPQSTTQARPKSSRGRRSSASSWVPPAQTGSCLTFTLTSVRVGIS